MHRLALRYVTPFVALLSIPFIYNSCQGKGFVPALPASSSCKIENGKVIQVNQFDKSQSVFSQSKVRLSDDEPAGPTGVASKATAAVTVAAGTQLTALIDNQCLQQRSKDGADGMMTKAAIESGKFFPELETQVYLFTLDRDYTDGELENVAGREPCVIGVSWNREYTLQTTLPPANYGPMTFNDSYQIYQAELASLHTAEAYSRFYWAGGLSTTATSVVIAVVDTGVDLNHPDLRPNLWNDGNGYGVDITTNVASPNDVSSIGHGTHVAGIIGAVSNNGIGIVGHMPYGVKIMPIKVFSGTGSNLTTTTEYFANALKFAQLRGANVINLSLGSLTPGPASDPQARDAVIEAVQNGVTVITVIGNADGGQNGQLVNGTTLSSIPGQYGTLPGVITVGSYDSSTGQKSSFSHYSPTFAEIGAPGAESSGAIFTGIFSTVPTSANSSGYDQLAGTSQAAPIVSAAAGLTYAIIKKATGVAPTPAEVERLLLLSAVKGGALQGFFKDGNRLDFLRLIQEINNAYPATATGIPNVNQNSSACQ